MFKLIEKKWNDGLEVGGRRPKLFVIDPHGKITLFRGENIEKILVIVGEDYTKNGKWSCSTFHFLVGEGVVAVGWLSNLHQNVLNGLRTWGDAIASLEKIIHRRIDVGSFRVAIQQAWPETFNLLDERQKAINSLI